MNRSLIDRRRAKELLARLHEEFVDKLAEHLLEERENLLRMPVLEWTNSLESFAELSVIFSRLCSEYDDRCSSCAPAAEERDPQPCQVKILQCAKTDIERTVQDWLQENAGTYPVSISLADCGSECTVVVIYYPAP